MIKDIRMNELDQIVDAEEASYHAFVWSHIREKQSIDIEVSEDRFIKSFIRSRIRKQKKTKRFEAPKIMTMSFGDVIEIKKLLQDMTLKDQLEVVSKVYGIQVETLATIHVTTFFSMFNYVVKEVKQIMKNEEMYLKGDIEADMMQAGVDKLNQFGILATVDTLAGNDVLKWEEVLEQRYSRVFTKMFMNKVRNDIEKKYIEIKKRKAEQEQRQKARRNR